MIKTHMMLMDELAGYASPRAKLTRMLKSGALTQVRRGLFVEGADVSPRVLAPVIYGPSYISFQSVLAARGLIPERVRAVMSVTFNKNKDRVFRTPFGEFHYLYLPAAVFPYGITLETENEMTYLVASTEKAICDAVYKTPGITSATDIDTLFREDWRMDMDGFFALDADFIEWIAPLYRRRSVAALAEWFRKGAGYD